MILIPAQQQTGVTSSTLVQEKKAYNGSMPLITTELGLSVWQRGHTASCSKQVWQPSSCLQHRRSTVGPDGRPLQILHWRTWSASSLAVWNLLISSASSKCLARLLSIYSANDVSFLLDLKVHSVPLKQGSALNVCLRTCKLWACMPCTVMTPHKPTLNI